jgi:Holin of 3TMs, for gene-transfer release
MIFDALIKPTLDGVNALISQFHLSPEQEAQARQALADASQRAQAAAADYDTKMNDIAGQNIRVEEGSNDKFTVRARPAVIWMGSALIAWNYGLVPVVGAHWHLGPANLPDAFWWAWTTVVTGYVFNRTVEKVCSLPGDSQINVLGMKIGNKS